MNRKERRALAHQERKLARKLGFPAVPAVAQPAPLSTEAVLAAATAAAQHPITASVAAATAATSLNIPEPGLPFPSLDAMTPANPISDAQLAANRANCLKSSGPKSEAGLAASSQNHTIHGLTRHNGFFILLACESHDDFSTFQADMILEHNPATPTEGILVQTMIESHWLAQRAQSLQSLCMNEQTAEITDEKKHALYGRYHTTHTRAFHKALNDLLKLRKEKRTEQNGFEAQKRKDEELRIKNERHEMKKQAHYWEVMRKDGEASCRISLNLLQKMQARIQFPNFDAELEAEFAKLGIQKANFGLAVKAAA